MYKFSKRLLDIIISLLALIILSPLLLPIIIILRFSAEGYVFYFQDRIGKDRVNFKIINFALASSNLSRNQV